MFDAEYFKNLLNETTALIGNRANHQSKNDELEMKIDANMTALKFLAKDIQDKNLRERTLERLCNLSLGTEELEINITNKRQVEEIVAKTDDDAELIERDVLKYTKKLHGKAKNLLNSLEQDSKILNDLSGKMQSNIEGTTSSLKALKSKGLEFSVFRLFILTFIMFIGMYFIIRFL